MLALTWFAYLSLQAATPETPELVATVLDEAAAPLRDLVLDPSGGSFVTLTEAGVVTAWTRDGQRELWRTEHPAYWALGRTKQSLWIGARQPAAASFDWKTGKYLRMWPEDAEHEPERGDVIGFVVDPKERWAYAGTASELALITETKVSAQEIEQGVSALALDEAGALLAFGSPDGSVRFAAAETGALDYTKVLHGPASPVCALAFGPRLLIAASEDGSLRLWNPRSGQQKSELTQNGAPVQVLEVHGDAFASGDRDGNVLLWSLKGGGGVRAHWKNDRPGTPIAALAFTPDGKSLLAAAGLRVLALDLAGVK